MERQQGIRAGARFLIFFLIAAGTLLPLSGCAGIAGGRTPEAAIAGAAPAEYPSARFAVISDLHFYSQTLGTEGAEFERELETDRKLLVESEAILREALRMIAVERPSFLIVSGDLTKDGERVNHLMVRDYLSWLEEVGVKVFVVPGNHDIMNFDAVSYGPGGTRWEETITAADFASIYAEMGYDEALYRDPSSLSYVAEPVPGLWLLALDSCLYRENRQGKHPVTSGAFSAEQVAWMEEVLRQGARLGKGVIALSHHGIVEHYPGQHKHYPEYLVRNYRDVGRLLASHDVRVVFTGHYHAQDITLGRFSSGTNGGRDPFVYDVETGSLVTWPCPIRFVALEPPGEMSVRSEMVDGPSLPVPDGGSFAGYARSYLAERITGIAAETMEKLRMKEEEIWDIAPQITDAFVAHYGGDERFTGTAMLRTGKLSFAGMLVVASRRSLVNGLWQDLPPADNDVTLDLASELER